MNTERNLPNLLIIGAQKSGTTWTHEALSFFDDVFASQPKELNFFSNPSCIERESIEKYSLKFQSEKLHKYYLESTPHYFRLPTSNGNDTAKNIYNLLGNQVKFILIFRNPIERAISSYFHQIIQKRLPYPTTFSTIPNKFSIIDLGFYTKIYQHYLSYFDENQFHVFLYDDLQESPKLFVEDLVEKLEIDPKRIDPNSKFDFQTNVTARRVKKAGISLPKLNEIVLEYLYHKYLDEIDEFGRVFNRDVSMWSNLDFLKSKYL